jgi:hypothetical protein
MHRAAERLVTDDQAKYEQVKVRLVFHFSLLLLTVFIILRLCSYACGKWMANLWPRLESVGEDL